MTAAETKGRDPSKETVLQTRPGVSALDALLGIPLKVLDDGFVRVIDYMGSDASIVQAARVSYGIGTRRISEDRGLIRYLLRHSHTTPFEMCEIKLHVRVPMDTWRQWIRHRTANVNEYSTRYSVAIDAAQKTDAGSWRFQASANRQGSEGFLAPDVGQHLTAKEKELQEQARSVYDERLSLGVAREQARKDLPLSTYTEAYWKIDLHNLLRFLALRMDRHAQEEIRAFATTIGTEIVSKWRPDAWQAFLDYQFNAVRLSSSEAEVIGLLASGRRARAIERATQLGLIAETGKHPNREQAEFAVKLAAMGAPPVK